MEFIKSIFRAITGSNKASSVKSTEQKDNSRIASMGSITPAKKSITFEEYLACSAVVFNWADSYDSKDWARLATVIAPELLVDYTLVSNQKWDSMTAADFIAMISAPGFLGDPLLKTQHLLGACEWEKVSDNYIIGHQQLRAGHLRFTDATHTVEAKRGHSHATNEFYYRKVNGVWKFAGLKPEVRWNEYEFETIFGGFECPRV